MPAITSTVFGPMLPKVDEEFLPAAASQLAVNLKLTAGATQPWKLPTTVAGVTTPGASAVQTLYRFGRATASRVNYWFKFDHDVNIVQGSISGDTEERTYWTDGTYPKKTKSDVAGLIAGQWVTPGSLRMGVPPPGWNGPLGVRTFTPVASVSGAPDDPDSTTISSTYVITYETTWGEESEPSMASNIVVWRIGQTVTVTCPGAIAGAYAMNRVRLFRSSTGTARTAFQYVKDASVGAGTMTDDATSVLGEICATWDWTPPPDGLKGLTDMGNGILAGFDGSTVYFCEPNFPYAWPAKYDFPVGAPIVGLKSFGQTLVVTTVNGVVMLSGTDPSSMSSETPKGSQACVSKRSMVEMLNGVVYASPDGLILVGPGITRNLTEEVFDQAEWQSYKPETMHAYVVDGRYIAFYNNGATSGGIVVSFAPDPGVTLLDIYATAGYVEDQLDALFLVSYSAGNTLQEWNTGSSAVVTWRSKEHRYLTGVCMTRAKVVASGYPLTFKLYGDGALVHTQTVANQAAFILPGNRNRTISYQIESSGSVKVVRVASNQKEMASG